MKKAVYGLELDIRDKFPSAKLLNTDIRKDTQGRLYRWALVENGSKTHSIKCSDLSYKAFINKCEQVMESDNE